MVDHLLNKHNSELEPYTSWRQKKRGTSRDGTAGSLHLDLIKPFILYRPDNLALLGANARRMDYQPYDVTSELHEEKFVPLASKPVAQHGTAADETQANEADTQRR